MSVLRTWSRRCTHYFHSQAIDQNLLSQVTLQLGHMEQQRRLGNVVSSWEAWCSVLLPRGRREYGYEQSLLQGTRVEAKRSILPKCEHFVFIREEYSDHIFEFHPNLNAHPLPRTNPISWYPAFYAISQFMSSFIHIMISACALEIRGEQALPVIGK